MAKVNLTKKIKGDRFAPVHVADNGRIKPDWVVINGLPEKHPDGRYYIDWTEDGKRHRKAVGKSAANAQAQQLRKQAELNAREHGVSVSKDEDDGSGRLRIDQAVPSYLEEVHMSKKHKTHEAYRVALAYFQESTRKRYVDEIERIDMLRFGAFLREEKEQSPRSVRNKFENVMTFLKSVGRSKFLNKNDWPRYVEEDPEIYSRDELDYFLSKCPDHERIWWEFFLMTGMREKEVVFCMWRNILWDEGIVQMRWKPEYRWTPKAYKEREVPIPTKLISSLVKFKAQKNSLVFPTESGSPKFDFLHVLKSRVKAYGLNPEEWWLHKFRATFATWHLQAGVDLRTVQAWLGHTDLQSTLRYLRPARGAGVQAKVNATFS